MNTLCIVPCGSAKIWDKDQNAGPKKARDVYTGSFASKCRQYAEKFYPSAWCILSAKHGFLFPDYIVPGPYNVSFNDKSTNPITLAELISQKRDKGLDVYEKIIVLGGKNYREIIKNAFTGKDILCPLEGNKNIMQMMKALNSSVKTGKLI